MEIVCKISEYFVNQLYKEHIIQQDEKDIYEYGFQITIANFFNLFIVIFIGILFHSLMVMSIFYAIFVSLRFYCGGYHANSYAKCFLSFAFTSVVCLTVSKFIFANETVQILAFPLSSLFLGRSILKKAPVEHINRPLSEHEKKQFKKRCIQLYIFWISVGIILWKIRLTDLTACFISTFILVSSLMYIKEENQNEENRT